MPPAPGQRAWLTTAALTSAAAVALASLGGGPGGPAARAAALLLTTLPAAGVAAAFALTAHGLGSLTRSRITQAPLRLAIGLALLLTLIHALGVLALLTPPVATALALAGITLGLLDLRRDLPRTLPPLPWWALLLAPPAAVLLVASASPPGWLWDSEFGAYDALSYHLQLPQEWARLGRIAPLEHNVYSFLPGSIESAFYFINQATWAPVDAPNGHALTAGNAWRAQATHTLQWVFAASTAWSLSAFVSALLTRAGSPEPHRRIAAWITAGIVLATPWIVVVGSIAYNELGVTALGAGAMLAAIDDRLRPALRGALAGALTGAACGCKPTAMLFVTPLVGVLLLCNTPRRAWPACITAAALAGLALLAPWMLRNAAATGNPVFPMLASVLGEGHWTSEQVARYASAHRFEGGVPDRLRLLIADDPSARPGATAVERWRGMTNPQWGLLFPAALFALGAALARRAVHRTGAMLGLCLLLQLLAWLAFTHLQSRFLLPCVLTAAPLIGLAAGAWAGSPLARWAAGGAVGVQCVILVALFAGQSRGHPNAGLVNGLGPQLGRGASFEFAGPPPSAWVNTHLDRGVRLYLLGDATPFLYERDVVYNTTWDAWPLAEAIRAHPDEPLAWTRALRAEGIDAVFVSFSELDRLDRSGWLDPALTPEAVSAWVKSLGEPMMASPKSGRAIFMLPGSASPSEASGG